MSRPLIQKRIDELEAMFAAQSGDADALAHLEMELAFRSVPRASSLLLKVKRVLAGGTVVPAATQNTLFKHKPLVAVQESLLRMQPNEPVSSSPVMSVEEALKTLRLSSASSWETVETSRRQIVDRAQPDRLAALSQDKRAAVQLEARRANAAYCVLFQERSR